METNDRIKEIKKKETTLIPEFLLDRNRRRIKKFKEENSIQRIKERETMMGSVKKKD